MTRRRSACMSWDMMESAGLPILGSLFAGGLIGIEREWRGRAAGFRTHILVCLTSTLLMLAAMSQGDWAFEALPNENIVTDPTRMAHGVLTGIGFLCAGVIFRTGFSIHGLTTAASLWITSAIGILFGCGLYGLGITGTIVTALILIALRLVSRRLPALQVVDVEVSWPRGGSSPEAAVEAALLEFDREGQAEMYELLDGGTLIRRTWRLKSGDDRIKQLAATLCALPDVVAYRLTPRDRS